ncbi:glycosyltransferase [Bacteroides ihuae]|uniref:glycosyltransferase n=1 Tax=Bacteroides ihuae TaxID=1852362 RepID=UPI0008D92AB0|nr:glycosyltransferase [Bacteroides ihuae]
MGKICCIFNIPSLYREAIYLDIDNTYDCEWYFEQEENGINLFDTNKLKSVHILKHDNFISRFYTMKGLVKMVWNRKDYDKYLMVGTPMCVSLWVLCILLKIFHPRKQTYFWTHGWYGKETFAERVIKKNFHKLADDLFIYGNYAKDLLEKEGLKSSKMHVIHNSLSYDVQIELRKQMQPTNIYKEHFCNSNPVLIFIGRLTPVKQLDMFVDAVAKLKAEGQNYNIVFVGDGPMRQSLEEQVEKACLKDAVWFYGVCYDEKANAELVFNSDLCVAPGNVGLTAIHTLMFGCPVVTHSNFAYQMPEFEAVKEDQTGNFFERGSADSLKTTISEWFRLNGNQREHVRKECYKEIDEQWNPKFQMKVLKAVLG